jgi:hypothetical protein
MHQEYIIIVNVHPLNICALKFIKQTLLDLKGQKEPNIIMVHGFKTNILQCIYHRTKISKVISELNYTIDQMALPDMCRLFYSKTAECTLFSATMGFSPK